MRCHQSRKSLVDDGLARVEPKLRASATDETVLLGRKCEAYGVLSSV
jgi:hypothetical protein